MAYKKLKYWFDGELAGMLAEKIQEQSPDFAGADFVSAVTRRVKPLELKDRVAAIAEELHEGLGGSFTEGMAVLLRILGPENEEETGMFTNYYWIMPIATYVERYGHNHFALSMRAIEEITKRNTGEYAIRPFLVQDTERTVAVMNEWARHPSSHVRRLASEGVRPRLPWARKLDVFIDDPSLILPILEQLRDDPSRYVQTSVANNLNDILKDNPQIGRRVIEAWALPEMTPERKWILKHALRNGRKKQDPWALGLLAQIT